MSKKITLLEKGNNVILQEAYKNGLMLQIILIASQSEEESAEVFYGYPIHVLEEGIIIVVFDYNSKNKTIFHNKTYIRFADIDRLTIVYSFDESYVKSLNDYLSAINKSFSKPFELNNLKLTEIVKKIFYYKNINKVKDVIIVADIEEEPDENDSLKEFFNN